MPARKAILLGLGVFTWIGAIATSFGALQRYAGTAGHAQAPLQQAAEVIAAYRVPGRPLLIMAVHPACPCTAASLDELGDLLARGRGACDALLLEYQPLHPPANWPRPEKERLLGGQRVPVIADPAGRLGTLLGAHTSGHVVFTDAQGTVRFHGGITLARAHRGRSPAQDAILAQLAGHRAQLTEAPVYGCSLTALCDAQCPATAASR